MLTKLVWVTAKPSGNSQALEDQFCSVLCTAHGKGYCVGSTPSKEKGSGAPLCCERGGGRGGREMVCVDGNTAKVECVLSCVKGATADGLISTVSISLG